MEIRLDASQRFRANAIIDQVQADPEIAAYELIHLRDKEAENSRLEWKLSRAYEMQSGLLALALKAEPKPDSEDICTAIEESIARDKIVAAAIKFHDYAHSNVGSNSDWMIKITTSEDEGGNLAALLSDLASSISDFRNLG